LGVHELHAKWLHQQHRDAEIEPAIEGLAERLLKKASENEKQQSAQESLLSLAIGNIYTAAEQHTAAERWYRRLVKLAPQQYAPLAVSLARQNRLGDAAALCIEGGKTDASAKPAIILAGVLGTSKIAPSEEVFRLAEPLLSQALKEHSKDTSLLTGIASLRVIQKRTAEALDLYRRVVALNPKDIQALNNLSTMLAEQPGTREEALRSIDEAIGIAGRLAPLLDTKGTILLQDGKAVEAVELLKEATMGREVDPRFLFHLSLACQGAGKTDDARKALQKAREGKLGEQILTPSDNKLLQELEQQLDMKQK
jgi:Flp pilus assembly protein TadD